MKVVNGVVADVAAAELHRQQRFGRARSGWGEVFLNDGCRDGMAYVRAVAPPVSVRKTAGRLEAAGPVETRRLSLETTSSRMTERFES